MKKYADVILPLPLAGYYTYSIPEVYAAQVRVGCRVIVSFGKKKYYTALVARIHTCAPEGYEVKDLTELLDVSPVVLSGQLKFWEWIASYYLCTLGEVYKAALPAGLKLESETIVVYNPEFEACARLTMAEQRVLDILMHEPEQSVSKLEKESGLGGVIHLIKVLLDKGAVLVREEMKHNYKPRTEARVRLVAKDTSEEYLKQLFDSLSRAPRQLALLMKYAELSGLMGEGILKEVSRKRLLAEAQASAAVFNGLVEKGIFETYMQDIGRLDVQTDRVVSALNPLNGFQQRAFTLLEDCFRQKEVCLLHGVTSSGKTEIYIHWIQKMLDAGKQVLYLLPEIALTAQITERLKRVFGSRLGIYHSKFSDAERVEIWRKQLGPDAYKVVLGVRSSIFLPFKDLGLVIVDEEHENTYKQQDPAPRYHARNAAIVLASMQGAKTILGTATPSVETYYNATTGKYGLVELKERYREIQLPDIQVVDIKELARKKRMRAHFSPLLLEKINEALGKHEQVILFQNRRGFAPMVECRTCGWVPKCKHCDVSLTYHKGIRQLTCHYCGYTYEIPSSCPACAGVELVSRGFGTEKIEDDIKCIYPEATVARMDLDTTRTRTAYEKIIADFEQGKTDILIGTQMVSKGLDFDRVSVVGILNADTMLNYPDFRSYERAYQLMAQVAGRAGRKHKRGLVVLQAKSVDLPVIRQVTENNYEDMYTTQLAERLLFKYPPYYRLVYVYLKHREQALLDEMSRAMAEKLRAVFAERILGPDNPPVGRIQNLYIKKIMIKIETGASMARVREQLIRIRREMLENERFRSLVVYYDIDPM